VQSVFLLNKSEKKKGKILTKWSSSKKNGSKTIKREWIKQIKM
jgi:hypothetical protein